MSCFPANSTEKSLEQIKAISTEKSLEQIKAILELECLDYMAKKELLSSLSNVTSEVQKWRRVLGSRPYQVLYWVTLSPMMLYTKNYRELSVKSIESRLKNLEKERIRIAEQLGHLLVHTTLNGGSRSSSEVDLFTKRGSMSDALCRAFEIPPTSTLELKCHVQKTLKSHQTRVKELSYPSGWRKHWVWIIPGLLALKYFKAAQTWQFLCSASRECVALTRSLFRDWILDPIENVYQTIRYKDRQLALVGSETLQADLQSLERMVMDYAMDNGYQDLNEIATSVQHGNLSVVMDAYENQIKSPIRSAVSGDLIRSVLIQVQKTKVDGALAMSALDKLLKANELNFAMLATIPTLLIAYGILVWIRSMWQGRWLLFAKNKRVIVASTLQRIERNIDLMRANRQSEACTMGMLLFELESLYPVLPDLPQPLQSQMRLDLEDLQYLLARDPMSIKDLLTRIWRTL